MLHIFFFMGWLGAQFGNAGAAASPVTHYLEGTIARLPVMMRVVADDRSLAGEYWYAKYKKPIVFYGIQLPDGKWKLNPKDETFVGSFHDGSFEGTWSHRNKELPFRLKTAADGSYWKTLCLKDPRGWQADRCEIVEAEGKNVASRDADDVDGDGKREIMVACASLCGATGNCSYQLFASNRGCFRHVGEVSGSAIAVLGSSHHGLRDLSQYWKGGCAAMEGTYAELHFTGTRYETARTIKCECKPDPARPKECPAWQN